MPGTQSSKEQPCTVPPLPGQAGGGSTYYRISLLDNDSQALWRNRFQDYLLWRSDKQCSRYKSELIADQFGANFGLNVVTTATAGVAGIVTAPAANILGALAAISSGTRGHFNEDFYQRFVAPAIIREIDTTRDAQLKTINNTRSTNGRTTTPIQEYTLEAAIADVERYQRLCSAAAALGTIAGGRTRYIDTAAGIKDRIATLREQLKANTALFEELKSKNTDMVNEAAMRRLAEANADLAKQIVLLQQQLLTAPSSSNN
jgi:hypothetical protein